MGFGKKILGLPLIVIGLAAPALGDCPKEPAKVKVENIERNPPNFVSVTVSSESLLDGQKITCAVKDSTGRYLSTEDNGGLGSGHVDTIIFVTKSAAKVTAAECWATPSK